MNQKDFDNKANQKNPNHWRYWRSRGYPNRPYNWRGLIDSDEYDSEDDDSRNNRANQKNPNHKSYWTSRRYPGRPHNWRGIIDSDEYDSDDNNQVARASSSSSVYTLQNSNRSANWRDTSTNGDSSTSSLATLAIVGFGLFALGKIIYDAYKESEEENEREKLRRQLMLNPKK